MEEVQGEKRDFFSAQAEKRDLREKKSSKEAATKTLEGARHQAHVPISSQTSGQTHFRSGKLFFLKLWWF